MPEEDTGQRQRSGSLHLPLLPLGLIGSSVHGGAIATPPGRVALHLFHQHKCGSDLFEAYVEVRAAVREAMENRQYNLSQSIIALRGKSSALAAELLTLLQVLDALDPIIEDLAKFCRQAVPQDDQALRKRKAVPRNDLAQLRGALRIWKSHAPHDAKRIRNRRRAVEMWLSAYNQMSKTRTSRSANAIAKEIARKVGVSQRTAINYWDEAKKEAHLTDWAREIEECCRQPEVARAEKSAARAEKSPGAGRMRPLEFSRKRKAPSSR